MLCFRQPFATVHNTKYKKTQIIQGQQKKKDAINEIKGGEENMRGNQMRKNNVIKAL